MKHDRNFGVFPNEMLAVVTKEAVCVALYFAVSLVQRSAWNVRRDILLMNPVPLCACRVL